MKSVHKKCPHKVSRENVHKSCPPNFSTKKCPQKAEAGRKVSGRGGAGERQGIPLTPPLCTVGCCS